MDKNPSSAAVKTPSSNFTGDGEATTGGVSEEITGEALQGRRDDVVSARQRDAPPDRRPVRAAVR
jgi:hypothetical protein